MPAKIYDRPERAGPPPAVLALIVLVLLVAAYFAYRAFSTPRPPQRTGSSVIRLHTAFHQEEQEPWRAQTVL